MVLGSRLAEPGMAARRRHAALQVRRQPLPDDGREPRHGHDLTELHTGYRAYSRELLLTVPFLRNSLDFAFDTEMLMQAAHFGFRIAEVPARSTLLRRRVLDHVQPGDGLRAEDARGGRRLVLHRRVSGARRSSAADSLQLLTGRRYEHREKAHGHLPVAVPAEGRAPPAPSRPSS